MEQRWYWRRKGGQAHGPVSTALLDDLIRFKNIGDTDEVRLESDTTWMNASEIRSLFSKGENPEDNDSGPRKIRRHKAAAETANPSEVVEEETPPSLVSRLLESCVDGMRKASSLPADLLSMVLDKVFGLALLIRFKWVLAIIAVLGIGFFVKVYVLKGDQNQIAMNEMTEIWEQMDLMLGRKSSKSDWSDFQKRKMEKFGSTLQQLEETARHSPRDPSKYWTSSGFNDAMIRSDLIQAGTTLQEIVKAGGGDERTRMHFHQKIDQVQIQMATGYLPKLPYGRDVPKATPGWSPMMIAMIIADVLAVGGVLTWWVKSR